jgi:hypothetical protein
LVRLGPTWSDLVRLGPTWSDLVRLGPTWSDLVRHGRLRLAGAVTDAMDGTLADTDLIGIALQDHTAV